MKKSFAFLLILLAVFVTEAAAQVQPQLGLRAGGALAQLRGKSAFGEDATDRKLGFMVGAFAEVPVARNLAVQPELLYVRKGGAIDESFVDDEAGARFESDFNLHYLELPVLAKYHVPVGGRLTPSVYAGPYVAYAVKRSIDFSVEGDGEDLDLSIDADDVFKRLDYGAAFGVDFGYRFGRRAATLGVRYDLGLANVFKDDAALDGEALSEALEESVEARTHELSVVLGVSLF